VTVGTLDNAKQMIVDILEIDLGLLTDEWEISPADLDK
jgi:hypothetical protein